MIMIDWVSIVRHSRRRFSNYMVARAPVRIKKRRHAPHSAPVAAHTPASSTAHSPQDDRRQYTCCCTHVSFSHFQNNIWIMRRARIEMCPRHISIWSFPYVHLLRVFISKKKHNFSIKNNKIRQEYALFDCF